MNPERESPFAHLRHGEHLCFISDGPSATWAALRHFFDDGLARGDRCVYLADDQYLRYLAAELSQAGVDVAAERRRGALLLEPGEKRYLPTPSFEPDRMLDVVREMEADALSAGFAGLFGVGDMRWALGAESDAKLFIEYEARLNELVAGGQMIVLCQYERGGFPPDLLIEVLRAHPYVVLQGRVAANPYFEPPSLLTAADAPFERLEWMLQQVHRIQRRDEEARSLYEAALAIGSALDLNVTLERVLDAALGLVQADGAEIFLADPSEDRLEIAAARGLIVFKVGERQPAGQGLTGATIASGRPLRVPDAVVDPRVWDASRTRAAGLRAWLGVPLADAGDVFGVLTVVSLKPAAFSADDERLLHAVAGLAGAAVREARLYRQSQDELAERRRVEQSLRQSEARLAEAQRIAHLGSWEVDHATDELGWSDELYRIIGLDKEEYQPRPGAFLTHAHPDDRARVLDIFKEIAEGATAFEREFRIIRPDGALRLVHARGERLLDQGAQPTTRMLGTIQDVTEQRQIQEQLRQSEARYRALIEHLPASAFIYQTSIASVGALVYVSPNVQQILGFPAADWLDDPTLWERRLHPDDRERVLAEAVRVRASPAPFVFEYRMLARDGTVVWLRDSAEAVLAETGGLAFQIGIMLDISERKQLDEERAALYRGLIEREAGLHQLVSRALLAQEGQQKRSVRLRQLEHLTPRERDVLRRVVRGLTNRQIAAELGLSVGTVKIHVEHLMAKLGVSHRAEAAVRGMDLGLLTSDDS